MGGSFSNGQDNDELVDNLVDSGYIRTKKIEQVFRAVDRGDYFSVTQRENAYKDFAWKYGNLHLSAPCIYCEVMEQLALKPGLSFLNLGSGTGYLSTMAGLLLTQSGINHGVEVYEECIEFSYKRLDEFKQKSLALDEFDFCEPVFVQGNCLSLKPGRRYDRVYCGATCPESHEAMIKEFVKVGGILIMPYKDCLVKIKRTDETTWEQINMMPVSFANLIVPTSADKNCHLPYCDPLSLQELCRGKIRRWLRQKVWSEHSDLETCRTISLEQNQLTSFDRALCRFVIPIFDEMDGNPSEEDGDSRIHGTRLLLNVDGPPGENLRTTLQLVRAVIQPNEEEEPQQRDQDINWPEEELEVEEEPPSTEEDTHCGTNVSSERERQDSESSSDSACEKSRSESNNPDNNSDRFNDQPGAFAGLTAYLNMIESESEPEDEERDRHRRSVVRRQSEPTVNRRKTSRSEKADSGIVEDEASTSSDSDLAGGTPVKHKRSNSGGAANEPSSKRGPRWSDPNSPHVGHYVDSNAFSSYMKEKIHQLPLPYSLKLYINYNRNL